MNEIASQKAEWRIEASDEAATIAIATELAPLVKDVRLVTLTGDLGAGKTTFARALIRAIAGDPSLETPSPTFTLMQVYEGPDYRIVHADLYRIGDSSELANLGFEEETEDALVLVEWAERAPELFGGERIDVQMSFAAPESSDARKIAITGYGAVASRLATFKSLTEFLTRAGWKDAERTALQGDASTRKYETLRKPNGESAILMISPPRPDGPPVRYGRTYGQVAKLAENIKPFVAVCEALRAEGLSAPRIFARDLDAGYAVLEDLGHEGIADENGAIAERYLEAVTVLGRLHGRRLPDVLPVEGSSPYRIPSYDLDALLIEVELLVEWYAGRVAKTPIASGSKAIFVNLWRQLLIEVATAPSTWTLRDYHSPNLLWLPGREGAARIGILDFQDCVMGHPAYDVVSLTQDARVAVPEELEIRLLGHYARLRRAADPTFDMAAFARAYAILGAQRATKVLGIFARLDQRDNKPQYLAHLPRVEAYLRKGLRHPALADIKAWYEASLPYLFRGSD